LHCDEAGFVRFAHQRQELKPEIVIGALDELAHGPCGEVRQTHLGVAGPSLELLPDWRRETLQHACDNLRPVEVCNELS